MCHAVGQPLKAVEVLEALVRQHPADVTPTAVNILADLYLQQGRCEDALALINATGMAYPGAPLAAQGGPGSVLLGANQHGRGMTNGSGASSQGQNQTLPGLLGANQQHTWAVGSSTRADRFPKGPEEEEPGEGGGAPERGAALGGEPLQLPLDLLVKAGICLLRLGNQERAQVLHGTTRPPLWYCMEPRAHEPSEPKAVCLDAPEEIMLHNSSRTGTLPGAARETLPPPAMETLPRAITEAMPGVATETLPRAAAWRCNWWGSRGLGAPALVQMCFRGLLSVDPRHCQDLLRLVGEAYLAHASPEQAIPYLRRMLEPFGMASPEALDPGQRAEPADAAKETAADSESPPGAPVPPVAMQHSAPQQPLGAPPVLPLAEMQGARGGTSAEPGLRENQEALQGCCQLAKAYELAGQPHMALSLLQDGGCQGQL